MAFQIRERCPQCGCNLWETMRAYYCKNCNYKLTKIAGQSRLPRPLLTRGGD